MLKLKNCGIPKGFLAQALWLLVDPEGSPSKIAIEVHYVKYVGIKMMTKHFCLSMDHFIPPLPLN